MRRMRTMTLRTIPLLALALGAPALLAPAPLAAQDKPMTPPDKGVPIEKFFKGRILKVVPETRYVEILYDFDNVLQLDDFELSIPFRDVKTVRRSLEHGKVRIEGTGSLRHKAVFDDKIGASVTVTPNKNKDFGFAVTEERESEVFTLYCVYDRYFGAGDGVLMPQNMIIKFIPRDPKINKDGSQDWRYCGLHGQKPEIERGGEYKVEIERSKNWSRMNIDDGKEPWTTGKSREASRDLTSQMFAFYVKDSDFKADDLTLKGNLHVDYVGRHKIDLTTWKPPAEVKDPAGEKTDKPAGPTIHAEAAAVLRAKFDVYPAETKYPEMTGYLRDPKLPEEIRAEAAAKAVAAGDKRLVPFLVEGLHADQDGVSRKLCWEVVSKLLPQAKVSYKWDGPEDGRLKAIVAINKYIADHAAEFR